MKGEVLPKDCDVSKVCYENKTSLNFIEQKTDLIT